ncbi:MAG: ABC-type transport auxiliary lipoprotein family protein [Arenicellales bacterium]
MMQRVENGRQDRRSLSVECAAPPRGGFIRRALMAAILLLTLTACATQPVPSDHYYRLDITPPKALPEPKLDGVVEVERFEADSVTADRPIVYTSSADALELKAYNYHLWTQSPTVMLRDALIRALRAAGIAREVVAPEDRASPDYVITGGIKRMERVVGTQPGQAILQIELVLRQRRSGKLLILKSYRIERDVEGDTVADFVAAMNGAASEVFARFTADLARL